MEQSELQNIFKAISDENRLKIIELLSNGETCACKLIELLDISQPNLSHHMGILQRSGLVTGRKDGQWVHYSLNIETLKSAGAYIDTIIEKVNESNNYKTKCDSRSSI